MTFTEKHFDGLLREVTVTRTNINDQRIRTGSRLQCAARNRIALETGSNHLFDLGTI